MLILHFFEVSTCPPLRIAAFTAWKRKTHVKTQRTTLGCTHENTGHIKSNIAFAIAVFN